MSVILAQLFSNLCVVPSTHIGRTAYRLDGSADSGEGEMTRVKDHKQRKETRAVRGAQRSAGNGDRRETRYRCLSVVVERVLSDLNSLVETLWAADRSQVAAYRDVASPETEADVKETARRNIITILRCVKEDRGLTEVERDALAEFASRRLAQGFPERAVLKAYDIGRGMVTDILLTELARCPHGEETRSALVARTNGALARLTREIMDGVSAIYDAGASRAGEDTTQRHALDRLFEGRWDDLGPSEQARTLEILGFTPAAFHAVAVLTAFAEDEAGPNGVVPTAVVPAGLIDAVRDMAAPGCVSRPWVGLRDRSLVVIAACASEISDRDLASELRRAVETSSLIGALVFGGVGQCKRGVAGIKDSFEDACVVLDLPRTTTGLLPILAYREAQAELVLLDSPVRMRELVDEQIAPLLRWDRNESRPNTKRTRKPATTLLATLEASVEAGWNVTRTADLLRVDPKTVQRKWKLIEALTGWCLKRPRDRHLFELALRAFQLLPPEERERYRTGRHV